MTAVEEAAAMSAIEAISGVVEIAGAGVYNQKAERGWTRRKM